MTSERFCRICPLHRMVLEELLCPAGHDLGSDRPSGLQDWWVVDTSLPPEHRFWRLFIVHKGIARPEEWYEDLYQDLSFREPDGMSAGKASSTPYNHAQARDQSNRRYLARLKAQKDGTPVPAWAALR